MTQSANPPVVPEAAWSRPIGQPFDTPAKPRVHSLIDPLINDGPYQGLPIGGLGSGSIGRTFRGDFARDQLQIGSHHYGTMPANMFSVFVQQEGMTSAQVLFTGKPNGLDSWTWDYPVGAGTYYALYPRAWFTYDAFPVKLMCEQFSPIIPHNYQESSYPVGLFHWTVTNPTDAPITVGLMLTWASWVGRDTSGGQQNQPVTTQSNGRTYTGVLMTNPTTPADNAWSGSLAIAAEQTPGTTITTRTHWNANGDGSEVWESFAASGSLTENPESEIGTRAGWNETYGAAVAVTFTLAPGQTREIPFAVAWDQPVMTFPIGIHVGGETAWYKRYTAFWGRDGSSAFKIAADGLTNRTNWRDQIVRWQQPILDDPARPLWYKTALFNELYYLVDGGTAWEHGEYGKEAPRQDYFGGFLYLECFDYLHYSTTDVDFYASFALLELFPDIEKRLIRDIADAVPVIEDELVLFIGEGQMGKRKLGNAVPHDLGGPYEDPWRKVNHYIFTDCNFWKDLNPKFVLRVYRDAILLDDTGLFADYYSTIKACIDYLAVMDEDGDGIPDCEGPDQTYDEWPACGVTAYSGGLWIASLHATREIALFLGDVTTSKAYRAKIAKATETYNSKLWNGRYYLYDSSDSEWHDSIMADQLAGQWYGDLMAIQVVPDERVESALQTIYAANVQQFGSGDTLGKMGAVNGMRPDGTIDTSSTQSEEMWSGITYGLASFMLLRGMEEQAWATAYGVYRLTYESGGMWFRTPEAFDVDGAYRASEYLRPLAIWALETALRLRANR
ncbi:MAG: non-lysosomal glucosylceramidase [Anaerolineae bacterium]